MKLFKLALCTAIAAASLYGQTGLASITGTVTDPSGAVIANAPISVRNTENGVVFTASSSDTGNYTVSQLPIGDYDLTVTIAGFKTYTHTKFHLAVGQTMREDITMNVGQTSESVTVTAESSLLKTETTEVSQNVTLSQLNNLPVLVVGATNEGVRDPFASVRLVPGIRYNNGSNIGANAAGTSAVNSMVVNGTPANTFQARLDGMTINPTVPRTFGAYMQTQPSVDAIQEVAIETSNFGAEFGTSGGAMINMVTKSGTNQFHGSGYDYATNEALNAHQPYTGVRNVVKQHDWGYTVGGPVWLPKLYDGRNKTFFFWSYEQFRQKNFNTSTNTTVPIPAYRNGDFSNLILQENRLITTSTGNATDALGRTMPSGTIFNPASQNTAANGKLYRDPFPGNAFSPTLYDDITKKVLPLVPLPLGGNADKGQAGNNYAGVYDSSRTSAIPSIKMDQNMGAKGRLSIYYHDTHTLVPRTPTGADGFADLITGSVASASSGQTARVNYDYTVTPRLLLHVGAGWNDNDFKLEAQVNTYDSFKELGLTGQTLPRYFPRLVVGASTNTAIGGMTSLGQFFPDRAFERRPSGTVSASYVTGAHTFKFGSDWRMEKGPRFLFGNTNGTYTFGAAMTEQPSLQGVTTNQGFDGFEFASFLLGGMSSNTQAAPITQSYTKYQTALFVQDNWKVTRKLTLDYGVRWDYGTYAKEQYGRNGSIGLAIPNPSAGGRLGAMQFEATCNCNFADNYRYAIGPRLGAGYQINRKTVLRAGIGVVYNSTTTAQGAFTSSATTSSLPANGGQITGLLKNGMPADVHAVWPSFDPGVGQGPGQVISMPALLDKNAGRPARLLQWSVGIQREFNRNLVVEATYVANRGVWWTAAGLAPLNSLNEKTLRAYGFNDFTSSTESALLTTTISSLTTGQKTTLGGRGINLLPYSNFPTTSTALQSLRDYPQYGPTPIIAPTGFTGLSGSPLGNTWYDSLQVSATERFSHGLAFNINYNFAKNLDLMSSPDVFNRSLGKNLSGNDLPHQLRITLQYQVPVLAKAGPGVLSNRWVSQILSDWGVGVAFGYQSAGLVGLGLGLPTSSTTPNISNFLSRGPGPAQLKTDADGNPMNPWSVDWTDYDGVHHTDPIDLNCHCYDPTKTVVLNPNAWTNIPAGQWGANQSSIRSFRGFRTPSESANLNRNFRFKEGRVNLNVRVEFTNVFNRMQLPAVTLGNFATTPTKENNSANKNFGLYTGGYGTIVPTSGTNGMRTGSLVGRITF